MERLPSAGAPSGQIAKSSYVAEQVRELEARADDLAAVKSYSDAAEVQTEINQLSPHEKTTGRSPKVGWWV